MFWCWAASAVAAAATDPVAMNYSRGTRQETPAEAMLTTRLHHGQ